jgi:hypothetical protein
MPPAPVTSPLFSTGSVVRPATVPPATAAGMQPGVPVMSPAYNNAALIDQQQQQQERQRNFVYGGLAAAAVLGVGIFAITSRGNADDPVVDNRPVVGASAAEMDAGDREAKLEDLLASAERLVNEKKFSSAQRVLDAAEDDLKDFPLLLVRASELSVRLETERMLASGLNFESSGDKISALKIYRNVLGTDASNAEAQARIKALVGDASFAFMTFVVDGPAASVTVDGIELGSTPITHPLAAGKHQLIVKAEGYKTYTTTISVASGKDEALKIPLEARSAAVPHTNPTPPTQSKPVSSKKPPPVAVEPQPPATKPKPKPKADDDDVLMTIPSKKGK